jgi:hypothetical protein
MDQLRKLLREAWWLTLGFAVLSAVCDLVGTSLDLGRNAGWWP